MSITYPVTQASFVTPRGNPCLVYIRKDTNDWNTAFSCLNEDEYRLRDLWLSGTAVDIGGYLGTVTLPLLLDNPGLHVICVEPIPENLDLIRSNLEANGVADRCTLRAGAVGVGSVTIKYRYTGSVNDLHHAFVGNAYGSDAAGTHSSITYRALSFRDLVGDVSVPFVKIDCEGGLWAILHEMTAVPLIAGEAEPVPLPDGTTGSRALLESILGPTHDIEWGAPAGEPGDWGFWATLRQSDYIGLDR